MNRLALRVVSLEQDARHVRPLSHEDALAVLDADPRPIPDCPDGELDAARNRLLRECGEGP